MDIIQIALNSIGSIIAAILVPAVLLIIFLQTLRLAASGTDNTTDRIRKWLALLLGLSIFALVVTLHISAKVFVPTEALNTLDSLWIFVLVGLAIGPLLLALVQLRLFNEVLEFIFIALLSAITLSSLYSYVFIDAYRGVILATTLGIVVGALVYAIFDRPISQSLVRVRGGESNTSSRKAGVPPKIPKLPTADPSDKKKK